MEKRVVILILFVLLASLALETSATGLSGASPAEGAPKDGDIAQIDYGYAMKIYRPAVADLSQSADSQGITPPNTFA